MKSPMPFPELPKYEAIKARRAKEVLTTADFIENHVTGAELTKKGKAVATQLFEEEEAELAEYFGATNGAKDTRRSLDPPRPVTEDDDA